MPETMRLADPIGRPADVDLPQDQYLVGGTRVEVRNQFTQRWSRGFVVSAVVDGRYELTRMSDGEVLPVTFDSDLVRMERKKQGLWWA